jgi:hypothetical protein
MNNFSYKQVYQLCTAPNADLDQITQECAAIFASQNLFNINDHEYAYALFSINSELYTMETYFKNADALITSAHLLNAVSFDLAAATYEFLRTYDFTQLRDTNSKLESRVERLNALRNKALCVIDVHTPEVYGALAMQPDTVDVWNCSKISTVKPIDIGDPTICTETEFVNRFHDFTFDVMQDFIKQPFAKQVLCCGGSIAKLVNPNVNFNSLRQTDLDLFIFAKNYEERSNVLRDMVKYFEKYDAYYAIVSSVVSVYLRGIKRKFQIISINASDICEILTRFDFTHVQIGVVFNEGKMRLVATHSALLAHRSRCSRINNIARLKNQRMIKTLSAGFNIQKHATVDDIHFTALIAEDKMNPLSSLSKIIVELSKYYYVPAEVDDELNVISMIQNDAKTDIILRTSTLVMNNITISGSFEGGYETFSYKDFRLSHIRAHNVNMRRCSINVMTATGDVKILSDNMILLERKMDNDDELILKFSCSKEFIAFITDTLEKKLWRLFTGKQLKNPNIIDDVLTIRMLASLLQTKKSRFQDQRGKPLSIDDIADNDTIQVMFRLSLTIDVAGISRVVIKPMCFIKMCAYVDEHIENEPNAPVNPPPELNWKN